MTCKLPGHPWFGKNIFEETAKHVFNEKIDKNHDNDPPKDKKATDAPQSC